jgi:hypothetical protein
MELGGWHDRNLTEKTEKICLFLRLKCVVEKEILYGITGILYNIMM